VDEDERSLRRKLRAVVIFLLLWVAAAVASPYIGMLDG
jgi:hypothetical protein